MTRPVVLVVDDEPTMRETLTVVFEAHGYQVRTGADVAGGRGIPFDLALIDLHLGRESGLVLVRELVAKSDAPVLVLSATADPEDCTRVAEAGAWALLAKPISFSELGEVLSFYLGDGPPDAAIQRRYGLRTR